MCVCAVGRFSRCSAAIICGAGRVCGARAPLGMLPNNCVIRSTTSSCLMLPTAAMTVFGRRYSRVCTRLRSASLKLLTLSRVPRIE
jgi:hypothetical protein